MDLLLILLLDVKNVSANLLLALKYYVHLIVNMVLQLMQTIAQVAIVVTAPKKFVLLPLFA
jgi:hypothetical protein